MLQQVGTPEQLYVNPENVFVAGFIGSPAMNLVPGGLLPGAGSTGQIVGFRPEHVRLGDGGSESVRVTAPVEVVEYLGDEQLVHFTVKDHTLLAKLPVEPRVATGSNVALTIPRDRLHLFAAEGGEALRR